MHVTEGMVIAFVKEHYGDQYKIVKNLEGSEIHVPSNWGKGWKTNISLSPGKVGFAHDYYYDGGWKFYDFVKVVKDFESDDDVDNYLMQFLREALAGKRLKDILLETPTAPPAKHVNITGLPKEARKIDFDKTTFPHSQFTSYLKQRGFEQKHADKYHLHYCTTGEYAGRIIIPFIENDKMIWFQGRAINKGNSLRYMNPVGASKSLVVYNLDSIKDEAILVEGPFDAMTVDGQAIMGRKASSMQIGKILSKNPKRIVIVPDIDLAKKPDNSTWSPGLEGARDTWDLLLEYGYRGKIEICFNPYGKDLNAIGATRALELVKGENPTGLRAELELAERISLAKQGRLAIKNR